jgi:pyruvate/2-oxoglutarate dehydrogenase complex dihydrolipoamide acyltransferase (E2) component
MSSLNKVIRFAEGSTLQLSAGGQNPAATITDDDVAELVLSAELGLRQLKVLLADDDTDTDPDDDEDDDQGGGKSGGGSHAGHPTFKKLTGKGMNPKMAAAMCAKADNKVKASQLCDSLEVVLAGLSERGLIALAAPAGESAEERRQSAANGEALPDGSYPIPDKKHLHSAAILAASGHGNVSGAKRLIRKRAREMGVDVNSLPGFGSGGNEKVAASAVSELVTLTGLPEDHAFEFLALARKAAVPLQAFHHGQHSGMHSHGHLTMDIHEHDHAHNGDSMHDRHSHGGGEGGGNDWGSRGGEY